MPPDFDLRIDLYGRTEIFDMRHIIMRVMTDWEVDGVQVGSTCIGAAVLRTVVAASIGCPRYSSAVNVFFERFDNIPSMAPYTSFVETALVGTAQV